MSMRFINGKTAALIFSPVNRRYLTGFPSSLGYLIITENENILFVDGRYFEAATKKVNGARVVLIDGLFNQINDFLSAKGIEKLLIETENEISFLNGLRKGLKVKVSASASLSKRLFEMRSIKSKEELQCSVEAQRIAEKAFCDTLEFIKEGVTEREIAAFLEYRMKLYGSEAAAFETIAVSGANSSLPHGVPTDKKVCAGDFITMDFGAVINGYCSDMTRTVAVGYVTDQMREVYETVLRAQTAAENIARAGVLCRDYDKAAREVITDAGYGEYFIHSTGHGIGLEVHEIPTLSPRSGEVKLRRGQLISNEPGIYLPSKFGVRIEDMLFITKNGCKNLTKAEKSLIIL